MNHRSNPPNILAMTSDAAPEPCSCGTGAAVMRCPAGHIERVPLPKPGKRGKARCPHRETPGAARCNRPTSYSAPRDPAGAPVLAGPGPAAAGGLWPGEAPPMGWRGLLGDAVPGTGEWCASIGCPCGAPDMRYTNGHTVIACPDARCVDCWAPSPAALGRADRHRAELARQAERAGRVAVAVPQAERDAQARQLRRAKDAMLRRVDEQLAIKRLSPQSASDLGWFRDEIEHAGTIERAAELAAQLAELQVTRRVLGLRVYAPELDDDDQADEDYDGDEDYPPDPAAGVSLPARPPLALPAGPRPPAVYRPCGPCWRGRSGPGKVPPALARVEADSPAWLAEVTGEPMLDVCGPHFLALLDSADQAGRAVTVSTAHDRPGLARLLVQIGALPELRGGRVVYPQESAS